MDRMCSRHGDMRTLEIHKPIAFWSENLKGRDHYLGHLAMDGKIISKSIREREGMDSASPEPSPMAGFYEHNNVPSGSVGVPW
jgi:hypothetical protein